MNPFTDGPYDLGKYKENSIMIGVAGFEGDPFVHYGWQGLYYPIRQFGIGTGVQGNFRNAEFETFHWHSLDLVLRGNLFTTAITPNPFFTVGYGVVYRAQTLGMDSSFVRGGLHITAGVGARFDLTDAFGLGVDLGYEYQNQSAADGPAVQGVFARLAILWYRAG